MNNQIYIVCRTEPSAEEMESSIFKRTDDAHRENKSATTRYNLHMIALVTEVFPEVFRLLPVDPLLTDFAQVLDNLALECEGEQLKVEDHLWYIFGPLNSEQTVKLYVGTFNIFVDSCHRNELVTAIEPVSEEENRPHLRIVEPPTGSGQPITE